MNLGRKPCITQENGVGSNGLPLATPTMSGPNVILAADSRGNPMTNWREPPGVTQWSLAEMMNLRQEPQPRPHLIDPCGTRTNQMEILTRPGPCHAKNMQMTPMERVMINHSKETLLERQILPGSIPNQVEPNKQIPHEEPTEMADWQELVDIYGQFLQSDEGGEKTGNVDPVGGANRAMGASQSNPSIEQVQSINLNQNVGANQSRPTLAEVLWKRNLKTTHHSNAAPDKNAFVNDKPLECSSYSQFEGNYCYNSSDNNNNRCNPLSSYAASDVYSRLYHPQDGFCIPGPTNRNLYSHPSGTVACSSTASFTTLAPVTPDKVQDLRSIPPDTVEKSSSPEEKQETVAGCTQEDNNTVGHILNPQGSSSDGVSPLLKEHSSGNAVNGDVDPNIQTPKLKPRKRRKHRPKVVVEGKPKRTRKASAKKTNTPKENPTGKRKYVRRKNTKRSPLEQSDSANEVSVSNGNLAKPCKRALKFNIDNEATNESHEETEKEDKVDKAHKHRDQPFNFDLDAPQSTSRALTSPAQQADAQQQAETYSALQKPILPSTPSATSKSHTLNAIARNLNTSNAILYQDNVQNVLNQTTMSQNRVSAPKQSALQSISQLVTGDMSDERRSKRDYHQYSSEMSHLQSIGVIRSRLLCHEMSRMGQPNIHCASLEISSEAHKKRKSENKFYGTTATSTPSCVTHIKDLSEHVQRSSYISHADERLSKTNPHGTRTPRPTDHRLNDISTSWQTSPLASELQFLRQQHASGQLGTVDTEKQCNPYHLHSREETVADHISRQGTGVDDCKALTAISNNFNNQYPTLSYFKSLLGHESRTSATTTLKKLKVGRASSNQTSQTKKPLPGKRKKTVNEVQASTKARGLHDGLKYSVSIDILAIRLERIVISDNGEVPNDQNALIPYNGDRAMIPFEEYDLTKRRKPRPKVDLDPDTSKLWDLLMGKEGSESTQTMDKDKEKWWEEEREVFRGRADSFIARMHLVQGDRRFSRWKGSVVDSVIGVFLTQNVTDHLSSSAFMSLAARFPVKQSCMEEAHGQNNITAWVEEPDIQVMDPDGSIIYRSIQTQSRCNQSSLISSDKSESAIENIVTGEVHLANEQTKRTDEELISSQNSSESYTFQVNEEVRSSSGSNSEAEDQTSEQGQMNFHSDQTIPQNIEFTVPFPKFQHQRMGVPLFETSPTLGYQQSEHIVYNTQNVTAAKSSSAFDCEIQSNLQCVQNSAAAMGDFWSTVKPLLESEEVCFDGTWEETAINHSSAISREKTTDYSSKRLGQMAGKISSSIAPKKAAPMNQPPGMQHNAFLLKSECHANLQHHSCSQYINQPTSHEDTSNVIQTESTITADSHPAETNAKRQSEWHIDPSSKQSTGNDITAENARKRKMADRKPTFDWDSLRKQVQSKNDRKGRSKDAMDSIDYEALRHAEVKQISDAIKERGMNNMLAERIKEFLNRIVREHGSIDLEWLRDVPPDKVKEYLLSIRGLGLKSVECVRLLTLHNLAFPVDTNVGRIAVRLGWVPLQQLPESLQLHLLELYPVLETIQKYLWPRLCKLDQKTLYELHYQMITFGKVFCTKSKPNCNACPMRAECRHFASAFASARLALPGPEVKGMVSSSQPVSANVNPAATFKPMPLLPGRSRGTINVDSTAAIETGTVPVFLNWPMPQLPHITSLNREAAEASTSNCEPIIEEPATPEPEVSASDIEDAYYEDPDYIPTIELNMKEFTANLQTVLQEQNMGMQEGDLSKALVALNPDAASIPTTKLKNISHLRTEHQVYELPDSHPLLKGMDRREPDDPSPYLLAIWTPGETANSIQLPETKCNTQASGKLCEETTCYSCSSARETNSQTVRGTLLIPCRTATRGSFPLNGTYFQVNEVFADHESSLNPIDVPRQMIWYLPRRTVYFGTSVSTIFKGLSTEQIQHCFWRGFVCVRGFDQKTRAPRPLMARLHFPASRLAKNKNETQKKGSSDAGVTAK
ncbi:hypothetical protein DM860_009445 [Cuscuta australis]|uniref:HhH-GPD domain-containing protein n=1 Tax=Cuscuta australis TaxID=267555 RepID=A0A328DN02_9ASTE|nr:hypothetical protein DM860_009445 [Cuscuta australis]